MEDEQDLVCNKCGRTFEDKNIYIAFKDQTFLFLLDGKATSPALSPNSEHPFYCKECWGKMNKEERSRWLEKQNKNLQWKKPQ